jgi:murein DD-endopeptidase MepM/ murein hydrolase activator NlpD
VIALIVMFVGGGLGLNYARMALKTADYNQLQAEIASLKVENKNLEVAARQLNTKIRGLENLSDEIQVMMENDTWNRRLGLVDAGGVGGATEDYPTSTMISSLNVRDNINLARGYTAALEDQLQFAEQLAARRAQKLLLTPSLWPVSGPIRSGYGRRRDPFTGQSESHFGLDIGALYGTAVRTPANGRVLYAQRRSAYGNLIVVDHGNGITTRFGHLSQFAVDVGDQLVKGDLIGYVGSTGRSTGPHLHYEVRLNDRPINPREYLPVDPPSIAD